MPPSSNGGLAPSKGVSSYNTCRYSSLFSFTWEGYVTQGSPYPHGTYDGLRFVKINWNISAIDDVHLLANRNFITYMYDHTSRWDEYSDVIIWAI